MPGSVGGSKPDARPTAGWRPVAWTAALGALVLTAFVAHPILQDHRLPVGPDGPVYIWWTKYASVHGLGVLPWRSGVPSVALALQQVLRVDAFGAVALLGPALAACLGLAAAALTLTAMPEGAWPGRAVTRASAAALLVAAWGGHLAAGYLGNLALAALLLAALAALAPGAPRVRGTALAAAAIAAAGLAHGYFLPVALGVLVGTAAVLATDRRGGRTVAAKVGVAAAAGGLGGFGLGALAGLGSAGFPGDTSQDAALRRAGLGDVLRRLYKERLAADAVRFALPGAAGVGLAAAARWRGRLLPFPRAILIAWGALTLVGTPLLFVGGGRAGRLIAFAFVVPLAAAVGFGGLAAGGARSRVAGSVLLAAAVAGGLAPWYLQRPYASEHEVVSLREAIEQEPGTPLYVVLDTRELAAGFHITRAANVARASAPAERIDDLRFLVGRREDVLAGRPTPNGDPEHDALSALSIRDAPGGGARGYGVIVPPVLNPTRGFGRPTRSDEPRAGISPWAQAGLSAAALLLLGIVGAGWSRWALGARAAALAAAPAAGLAVAILSGSLADRAGLRAGSLPWLGAILTAGLLGHVAARRG